METGRYGTIDELAASEKINSSYISRVLRLTLLTPDIVEAILDGRQPTGMTLPGLMGPFPVAWKAQHVLQPQASPPALSSHKYPAECRAPNDSAVAILLYQRCRCEPRTWTPFAGSASLSAGCMACPAPYGATSLYGFVQTRTNAPGNPCGPAMEHSCDPSQPAIRFSRKEVKGGSFLCALSYCRHYLPSARHALMVDTG
jgi:hypothetical protein